MLKQQRRRRENCKFSKDQAQNTQCRNQNAHRPPILQTQNQNASTYTRFSFTPDDNELVPVVRPRNQTRTCLHFSRRIKTPAEQNTQVDRDFSPDPPISGQIKAQVPIFQRLEQDPDAETDSKARPRCWNRVLSRTQKPKSNAEQDPNAEIERGARPSCWNRVILRSRIESLEICKKPSPAIWFLSLFWVGLDAMEDISIILCFSVQSGRREKGVPFGCFSKRHGVSSMKTSLHSRSSPSLPAPFSCHLFLLLHRHSQCVKTPPPPV